MRPLTLHVSALSDAEYDLYTASLDDLATDAADGNTHTPATARVRDDAHYEQTSVGVREARAWLRGRYSGLPATDIDAILKLFCPKMLPADTLTGGQFFTALRLVTHAQSGKGVDRTLAFVQASPRSAQVQQTVPRPLSPPKRPVQAPPSHPDRQKLPPIVTSSPETNPFARMSTEHAPPADPEPAPVVPPQRVGKISQNPFLARDRSDADRTVLPAHGPKLPPLPPRKPLAFAGSRRASEASTGPPLIPAKPTHVMSPLMRQSLEASKHAQSMKRAEEQLDRERVLQVLKTSSSGSSASTTAPNARTRSLSPSKQAPNGHVPPGSGSGGSDGGATSVPPLPRRRKPSLPTSTSSTVLSFEQVASATLPSSVAARARPPSRDVPLAVLGPVPPPPPTHPHRRPSTSTEPTVNDSQPPSPGAASSSVLLPPPPRRRRPESMQLTPTSDLGDLPAFSAVHGRTASLQGLSRHPSLTRDRRGERTTSADGTASPMAHLQRTLSHFQVRAQPKLDAVRYKAEAGLSRRGYVHHAQLGAGRWREEGEEGLMADARWDAADVDRNPDDEAMTDEESSSGEDRRGGVRGGAASRREFLTESDHLKWPMGEGWKPL